MHKQVESLLIFGKLRTEFVLGVFEWGLGREGSSERIIVKDESLGSSDRNFTANRMACIFYVSRRILRMNIYFKTAYASVCRDIP